MSGRGICSFIYGCPVFPYFHANQMLDCMRRFCLGDYGQCERRKLRLAGEKVPADLMPDGCKMEIPKVEIPVTQETVEEVCTIL
ncbi:MAG: hypothetical protein Kow00124_23370 [Anaerolineae bacterium]